MKKKIIDSYYDDNYVDSGYSLEEIEKFLQEAEENDKKLTDWPKDTQRKVVRKGKIIKVLD